VWVKKSELSYWDPQVFQIETDRGTVLDFQTVRFKDRPLTVFLFLMGLGCVLFPVYVLNPNLFSQTQLEEERQPTASAPFNKTD
jgi:hypothetical protein